MKAIDVEQLLNEERWNGYAKRLILATALTLILAGIDNQMLGNAIPAMQIEWNTVRSDFGFALSVGLLGVIIGGLLGGLLGDRIGRLNTLRLSVVVFAVMTLMSSAVSSTRMLTLLSFIFATGYGAAIPNAVVLAYEYVPKRNRVLAVTLTITGIPLGGVLASYLSRWILPNYGWRTLYILGGVISVALAFILFKELPESPQYLVRHRQRWPELIVLLRKFGHSLPADSTFVETGLSAPDKSRQSIRELFAPPLLLNTVGILSAFCFCQMGNYIGIRVLPVVLRGSGFTPHNANNALASWNLGGIVGALFCAFLIQRFGPRMAIVGMSAASVICAIVMTYLPIDLREAAELLIMLVLLGGFINAVQTALYILALDTYPSEVRTTGIGVAVAFSRFGNFTAGWVGVYALTVGAAPGYFLSIALVMTLTLILFALFRRHLEGGNVVVSEK